MAASPISGAANAEVLLGKYVERATDSLPQTTAEALFTVAGGRVAITAIIGQVTTIIETKTNNTKLVANPTTGSSVDICAQLDITGKEAGTLLGITGLFSDALVGSNAGATVVPRNPVVVNVGTIDLDCGASSTGAIKWQLWYVPIDAGATVTATTV